MIGLKRGTVKLYPHDPRWAKLFDKEKRLFLKTFGSKVISVEHIGSTSIPGISAKPIIDISVGVKSMRTAVGLAKKFQALGYEWRKDAPWQNKSVQILFVKGAESKRTHYVHVMRHKGLIWNNDILFRDYLRNNKQRAKQYDILKEKLAKRHSSNRMLYTKSKEKFVIQTIKMAKQKTSRLRRPAFSGPA